VRTKGTFLIVAARCPVCGEPVCLDRSTYQNNYECPLRLPKDIADVVALLGSDDAQWNSGQNLRVNGGIIGRRPVHYSISRIKSRNQAVSVASGRGPAASDRVTGRAVMALECALLLVEQMATVQGLDLSRRNARRVSRRYLSAWAQAQGLHRLNSLVKIESEGPGRK
jgi:hypothetical protein